MGAGAHQFFSGGPRVSVNGPDYVVPVPHFCLVFNTVCSVSAPVIDAYEGERSLDAFVGERSLEFKGAFQFLFKSYEFYRQSCHALPPILRIRKVVNTRDIKK